MFETVPNQRIITINRDMPKQTKDNKRPYMVAYTDVIEQAAQNLSTVGAFKVYMYCLCNQNGYRFGCSPEDISTRFGIHIDTAKKAINTLIEAGYLVNVKGNNYEFHETPMEIGLEPVETVKKKFRTKGGATVELTYEELVAKVGQEKAKTAWENAK